MRQLRLRAGWSLSYCWLLLLAMGIEGRSLAQPITFDFENGSVFDDNAGVGANMVASNGVTAVIMTTVDLLAPQYAEDPTGSGVYVPTGATLSAVGGANVVTNILSANNSVGINNPSITNQQYEDNFGSSLTESGNFNLGESWVFKFSADVRITEFNLSSLDAVDNDQFTVTVSGVPGSFTFEDGTPSDDFDDPLGDLIILAGTPITLEATGQINGSVRISEITVLPTNETGGPLLGDYNGDSKVSAADYTVWRDTLGSMTDLRANGAAAGSSSGVIDQDDYDVWLSQYGQGQFGAATASQFVVPEPPAWGLFAALFLTAAVVGRTWKEMGGIGSQPVPSAKCVQSKKSPAAIRPIYAPRIVLDRPTVRFSSGAPIFLGRVLEKESSHVSHGSRSLGFVLGSRHRHFVGIKQKCLRLWLLEFPEQYLPVARLRQRTRLPCAHGIGTERHVPWVVSSSRETLA